ncbi:hypothetical protein P8R33_14655 [Qipengyuania sp. XHP0211]|nr:hypothetical protein [Qipengyuania sp. XHP0211]MDG5752353.1 hypothetical protein [Qipengyuania sp. XHP0211]
MAAFGIVGDKAERPDGGRIADRLQVGRKRTIRFEATVRDS